MERESHMLRCAPSLMQAFSGMSLSWMVKALPVVGAGDRHLAVPAVDDAFVNDHSLGDGVGRKEFIIGDGGEAVDVAVGFMDIHAQIGKVFLLVGDAGGFDRVGNDQSDGTEDDGADDDRTEDFPKVNPR